MEKRASSYYIKRNNETYIYKRAILGFSTFGGSDPPPPVINIRLTSTFQVQIARPSNLRTV